MSLKKEHVGAFEGEDLASPVPMDFFDYIKIKAKKAKKMASAFNRAIKHNVKNIGAVNPNDSAVKSRDIKLHYL